MLKPVHNTNDYIRIIDGLYNKQSQKLNNIQRQNNDIKITTQIDNKLKFNYPFYNKYSSKIIDNCPDNTIIELACRSFVGSIEEPKNIELAFSLLYERIEKLKKNNETSLRDMEFFLDYFILNNKLAVDSNNDESNDKSFNFVNIDKYDYKKILKNSDVYFKTKFVFCRDLFNYIVNKVIKNNLIDKNIKYNNNTISFILQDLYFVFYRSKDLIYEANYYLGYMFEHNLINVVSIINKKGFIEPNVQNLINECNYNKDVVVLNKIAYHYYSIAGASLHASSLYRIYLM